MANHFQCHEVIRRYASNIMIQHVLYDDRAGGNRYMTSDDYTRKGGNIPAFSHIVSNDNRIADTGMSTAPVWCNRTVYRTDQIPAPIIT